MNGEERIGKAKQVGKKICKDKNVCCIETDEGIEAVDFLREVESWRNEKKMKKRCGRWQQYDQ